MNFTKQSIQTHTYQNGITLVAECMPWLKSAAFAISVPAGCQFDPSEEIGLANFTCEMVQRGCGPRNSRQFIEDLEELGADCSASVSNSHTSFGGAMPADSICETLTIYADVLRRPHLPADQFEEGRQTCLQEVRSLEDDLGQKTLTELRRRHYPEPFGRNCSGSLESIESITLADIRRYVGEIYRPNGLIVSVAGNVQWQRLQEHVGSLFDDWPAQMDPELVIQKPLGGVFHIQHESNQTHIGLAYPSVPYADKDYFLARGVVGVLSDGMSSRLFTEVREKRGLCYSVFASLQTLKDRGCIVCYAGTSAQRAQETLDVIVAELHRLGAGIEQAELDRLKVQIRSGLIMQQESSRSRAASIASDWYHLGRVRTLDEVSSLVNALTVERLDAYIRQNPPKDFNIVTLGPQPLEEPRAVSTAIS